MPKITKVYKQDIGPKRFIGKKYTDADRVCGMFSACWHEWFEKGWFDALRKNLPDCKETAEDADAPVGICRDNKDGEFFEYWIGLFMPPDTVVPEGYQSLDFAHGRLGVCWVYGPEHEVFGQEGACGAKLEEEYPGEVDHSLCFERYSCRFAEPDDDGCITLDICFFLK